jgi:hypothetical protein
VPLCPPQIPYDLPWATAHVLGVNDVMQMEIYTCSWADSIWPWSFWVSDCSCKVEELLIRIRQNRIKQMVQRYILSSINSRIIYRTRKNCLSSERSILLYKFTKRAIKLTVVIIEACHFYQLHAKLYPITFSHI